MVVCEPNSLDETFQDRPVVISEVLSETTRRIDEGENREAYLSIPSLMADLLIKTDRPRAVIDEHANEGFVSHLY
jgi:hypothetical protein